VGKTVTGKRYKDTADFLDKTLEPRVQRMVTEANKLLEAKLKVRVGCEITWFIEESEDGEEKKTPA
jgi:hypothetical protein